MTPHTITRPWIAPEHIARIYGDEEQAEAIRGRVEDDTHWLRRAIGYSIPLWIALVSVVYFIGQLVRGAF